MQIRSCMTKKVELANPQMTLVQAAQKMRDGDFGFMPVGENDRLVGIITDRDLAIRAMAKGADPTKTKLQEVMSKSVHYCFEDQSIAEVAQSMTKNKVRRMPVLNQKKRMVGVVSLADMARSTPDKQEKDKIEEALSELSQSSVVSSVHQSPA